MNEPNEHNSYITVRFTDVKEFLEELGPKSGRGIDCIDGVIRVTKIFTQSKTYPVQYVSVVAAMLRDVPPTVQCIKLERPCGQLLGSHDGGLNGEVMQRAEAIQAEIEGFAKKWEMEVRAGLFE